MGALAAVGVVLVLLIVWACVSVHDYLDPAMPDVHGISTSAEVATADRAATTRLDDALAQVRTAVPWMTDAGRSADDLCSTNDNVAFIGERRRWAPVSCMRTSAWFGAFDGSLPEELTRINRALSRAGWTPQATPMDELFRIDQTRMATASPSSGRPRPAYAYGSYRKGINSCTSR
ncbi:hypothetical protein GCM10025734_06030 [Kitasatospora paranensis]|uniref:hypothetical protein n=1 Tax=Kitasatospora paranensis TaxID=258053 RepID=UPI0031E516A5